MSAKLFVGNLSFNITENDLQDAFAAHGTVLEANLMMDRSTGRPRGFGFVTMSTPEEAQKAIDALNGKELAGRALTVTLLALAKIVRAAAAAAVGANSAAAAAVAVVVVVVAVVATATKIATRFTGQMLSWFKARSTGLELFLF